MDKKEFFESLVSLLPDESGHRLDALDKVREVFASVKSELTEHLSDEVEHIEREILSHVWMFEQICNGGEEENNAISRPLIVISAFGEILFVNRTYCQLSGLSPTEIQTRAKEGTLYSQVYGWADIGRVYNSISRLRAGKGYEHMELFMKHAGRRISWSSYGGAGESLEIRSGVEILEENDQRKEHERFYRGYTMNTTRLLEAVYHITLHGALSPENEQKLAWIQELLSMFDFLWNHSELFMEIIDMPAVEKGRVRGFYNTVYAQFFQYSFHEEKRFKDILIRSHDETHVRFLEMENTHEVASVRELIFRGHNKTPVARICWQYSVCPHRVLPEHNRILGIGVLVRKIPKRNVFIRIFRSIFKRNDTLPT